MDHGRPWKTNINISNISHLQAFLEVPTLELQSCSLHKIRRHPFELAHRGARIHWHAFIAMSCSGVTWIRMHQVCISAFSSALNTSNTYTFILYIGCTDQRWDFEDVLFACFFKMHFVFHVFLFTLSASYIQLIVKPYYNIISMMFYYYHMVNPYEDC